MKKKFLKAQETKSLKLEDAITMTKGDEIVYEQLRRSSDNTMYPALVVTPYMSKAAGYVSTGEIEGDTYNMTNAIMFLANTCDNKDIDFISNTRPDLVGKYTINRISALYSSIYTEILSRLSNIFSVFLTKVRKIDTENSVDEDGYNSNYSILTNILNNQLLLSAPIHTNNTALFMYASYDGIDNENYIPTNVRLAKVMADNIIDPSEANSMHFFNTILPMYMNEIIITVVNEKAYDYSNGIDNEKKAIRNDKVVDTIIHVLLPALHNQIIELYTVYTELVKSEEFSNVFNVPEQALYNIEDDGNEEDVKVIKF